MEKFLIILLIIVSVLLLDTIILFFVKEWKIFKLKKSKNDKPKYCIHYRIVHMEGNCCDCQKVGHRFWRNLFYGHNSENMSPDWVQCKGINCGHYKKK